MKLSNTIVAFLIAFGSASAQNPLSQATQTEVSLGFVTPYLQSGAELTRSQDLRKNQRSYFENSSGQRQDVGKYPALSGYTFTVGFYKPLQFAPGLMLGAVIRNAQTGSQPGNGGYEEAYFFNFITGGVALKYYPFTANNLFVKGDFGLASVLTKNRYLTSAGEQNFFHQFGIGNATGVSLGYSFTPFKNKAKALELQVSYQQLRTWVEVNGLGDDQWRFGAMHYSIVFTP